MKIFISWSKEKSKQIALKTRELLESVTPSNQVFVSDVDIVAGEDVQAKIIDQIKDCDKLVLCFTEENKKAPWLLFEAGYARGRQKVVIPLLFDKDPDWHSWIDNPMNVAREIQFNDTNFVESFIASFNLINNEDNRQKIIEYQQQVDKIKDIYRKVDRNCEDLVAQLVHNKHFVAENPFFRDKTAHFMAGFESFELYNVITEQFMFSGKYLWIYGRKNMKLMSDSFKKFFNYLSETARLHPDMEGIDFRCLFLDPDSEEVSRAHIRPKLLKHELNSSMYRASIIIGDNKNFEKCFKMYSDRREEIIIRLDNSIIYAVPIFDALGRPQLLTDTRFEVFSVDSPKGQECIRKFQEVWNKAKPFSYHE